MNSLSADIQFGLEREDVILQSVKKYFDTKKMIKSLDKYCVYDAEDTSTHTRYEIKARRNKYNAYPTTIIPYHKHLRNYKGYYLFSYVFHFLRNKDIDILIIFFFVLFHLAFTGTFPFLVTIKVTFIEAVIFFFNLFFILVFLFFFGVTFQISVSVVS